MVNDLRDLIDNVRRKLDKSNNIVELKIKQIHMTYHTDRMLLVGGLLGP